MAVNKAAIKALEDSGSLYGNTRIQADVIVKILIDEGFIEADVMSKPEELAERARKWLGFHGGTGPKDTFDKASGWSTESWKVVANDNLYDDFEWEFKVPNEIKHIFGALIILAKEAGIEL